MSSRLRSCDRRSFLRQTGLGSLGLGLSAPHLLGSNVDPETRPSGLPPAAGREAFTGEPLFRFLQINDTHYQSSLAEISAPTYQAANARVQWLLESLAGGRFVPTIDFILVVGDMTHQHTRDRLQELALFRRLLEQTGIPFFPVVGNHDNVQGEGKPENEAPYRQVFGSDRIHYAFLHKGIGFVVADNSGTGMPDLPPEAVERREHHFADHLDSFRDRPVIVACHVPLICVRQPEVLAESFGFASYYTREPGLLSRVRHHADHVAAVLSGHLHLSGVVEDQGVAHVVASGTASFPHDVLLHTVYREGLESRFLQLPSHLLTPSTNIHGWHRFGRDFTDAAHPDYMSFLMGRESERCLRRPFFRPV